VVEEYAVAPTPKSPALAALSTFAAFILCGLVPLVTYLGAGGLVPCVVATGFVFFAIGAIKSWWSLTPWWRSGLGNFFIGMSAAALAFCVGFGFRMLFNVPDTLSVFSTHGGVFKPLPGGWVYRAPNPLVFGDTRHYLVNDAQKAQIEAIMLPRRPALLAAMLIAGMAVWVLTVANLVGDFGSGHVYPTAGDLLGMSQ
jgi:hypothetical protein